MVDGLIRNIAIWITGFVSYFIIGEILAGFKLESFYVVRLFLFFIFVSVVILLYYINIQLRNVSYGAESNPFWKWIEGFVPFFFIFPVMSFTFSFIVIGLTYVPGVAPFNYFINYCISLLPFYLLVFFNDLSIYREHLDELWGVE